MALTRAHIQGQIAQLSAERAQLIAAHEEIGKRIVFANGQLQALQALQAILDELPREEEPIHDQPSPHTPAGAPAGRARRGRTGR